MVVSPYCYFSVWLFLCMAVSLYGFCSEWLLLCMAISLYGYLSIWLFLCMDISLNGCFSLLLFLCMAVSLYGYCSEWLLLCMAASLYCYFCAWLFLCITISLSVCLSWPVCLPVYPITLRKPIDLQGGRESRRNTYRLTRGWPPLVTHAALTCFERPAWQGSSRLTVCTQGQTSVTSKKNNS